MDAEERERQRVQRLQDAQVQTRDPGPSKIRHYDWSNQRPRRRYSLLHQIVDVVPTRMRGMAAGLLFGILLAMIIALIEPRLELVGILLIPVAAVVGWILGVVIQSQQ